MIIRSIVNKLKGSKLVSTKSIKTNTGRVYIHGNRLENTKFKPGAHFSIYLDEKNSKLTLAIDNKNGKYKVSKRKNSKGYSTPIIDLKSDKILDIFKNANMNIDIYEDVLMIQKANITADTNKGKVINFNNFASLKVNDFKIDLNEQINNSYTLKAVSGDYNSGQLSLFGAITSSFHEESMNSKDLSDIINNPLVKPIIKKNRVLKTISSLFCGCGGLDLSFIAKNKEFFKACKKTAKESYKNSINGVEYVFKFAIDKIHDKTSKNSELKDFHIKCYKKNIGDHVVGADILTYPVCDIPHSNLLIAGIPCDELSSVTPKKFKFNMIIEFFNKFIEIAKNMEDTLEVFVIENSSNLLTAGRQFVEQLKRELPDFDISENKVDSSAYGSFQKRKRAILIGSKIGRIDLVPPILKEVKTVRMAFEGLNDSIPNQKDVTIPKKETIEKFKLIKSGRNNKSLPEDMKNKGDFSNNCKRLNYDEPSITICNPRKSNILHPTKMRIITIREMLRLFDMPDDFVLEGNLSAMQQMACNMVPLALGKAIVSAITKAYVAYTNQILTQI